MASTPSPTKKQKTLRECISPARVTNNMTELMEKLANKEDRRKSIEGLMSQNDARRVRIPKAENGSYGFNLRGSMQARGHEKQRGQFVRSVDFSGPAHQYGLRAGDRVLAVNYVLCEDETHDVVTGLIKETSPSKDLELVVVGDPNVKEEAYTATEGLLKAKAKEVIHQNSGIPHFTVEMTEQPLGRTKMLQKKIFGTPVKGTKKLLADVNSEEDVENLPPSLCMSPPRPDLWV